MQSMKGSLSLFSRQLLWTGGSKMALFIFLVARQGGWKARLHWAPPHVVSGHLLVASPVGGSNVLPDSSGIKRHGFRRPEGGAAVSSLLAVLPW